MNFHSVRMLGLLEFQQYVYEKMLDSQAYTHVQEGEMVHEQNERLNIYKVHLLLSCLMVVMHKRLIESKSYSKRQKMRS